MKTYYDIAVIGGGVAGVAAAVQAARCGMKTVLVERTALVGGLATGGLINVFLPLCDELRDRSKPRTPLIFRTPVKLIQCLAESVPLVLRKFG